MKKSILFWVFVLLALPSYAKVAVVDMDQIFREYYKSKIAEEAIKTQAETYRNYLLRLNLELRKLEGDFRLALDSSQNIALSEEDRRKSAETAARLERDLKAKKAEAEQYATDKNQQMRQLQETKRKEILTDIQAEVRRRSLAGNIELVLDSSGKTLNDIPAVVYFDARLDLTSEVINELNRSQKKETIAATPVSAN